VVQEIIVEVPVIRREEVIVERIIESIREIEVPQIMYIDRVVEVPVERFVPVVEYVHIPVPVERFIEQHGVDGPQILHTQVLVEKRVEIVKEVEVEKVVTVTHEKPVEVFIESPVDRVIEIIKPVNVHRIDEKVCGYLQNFPVGFVERVWLYQFVELCLKSSYWLHKVFGDSPFLLLLADCSSSSRSGQGSPRRSHRREER